MDCKWREPSRSCCPRCAWFCSAWKKISLCAMRRKLLGLVPWPRSERAVEVCSKACERHCSRRHDGRFFLLITDTFQRDRLRYLAFAAEESAEPAHSDDGM